MKKLIWIIVLVLVVLGIMALSGGNKTSITAGSIKIGYVGPFTGPVAATSGEDIGNGWKLAVAKRPTLAGRPVEMIYEDDACDPKKAVSAVTKLINVDKVKIIVNGVCSGSMVAMAPVTEASKAILFTPVSTSPKITDAGDYVFRTSAAARQTAAALIKYLNQLNYHKIAILFETAEYPVGIKDSFVPEFVKTAGNLILTEEGVIANESDMRSQLLKLSNAKPEALVVLMNSTVTANSFVKQFTDLGLKLPVLANEYFGFDVVVKNPSANGMYATQYQYDHENPAYVSYLADYRATYGKDPSQAIYAALPFDGYNVLANAIESCGGDNVDCVRDALYTTKDYQGITGVITLDDRGDTQREFTLRKIVDGVLTEVN